MHTQHLEKLNDVWAGIVDNKVLGPFLFEEALTEERYLEFLFVLVEILPNENGPDLSNNIIWFQQDGATTHLVDRVSLVGGESAGERR